MDFQISAIQKAVVTVAPFDADAAEGEQSREVANLQAEVLSGDATVAINEFGQIEIYPGTDSAEGVVSQVRIFADSDLGEGETILEDFVNLTVVSVVPVITPATSLGLSIEAQPNA